MKVVGHRKTTLEPHALAPVEAHRRAVALQRQMDRIIPYPRPWGFVFKAPTWADYERWRREQPDPRLW